jgi:hypothetical protein
MPRKEAGAIQWEATIRIRGVNPYVLVAPAAARRLRPKGRGPIPVRLRVNGKPRLPWRVNLMPTGRGSYYLYLNGIVRAASGTSVGDRVRVRAEFDPEYRGGPAHPLPPAFAAGLARDPAARRAWDRLVPSRQKEILRYLAALRSESARGRNVDRALGVLGGRKGRFLGREWN